MGLGCKLNMIRWVLPSLRSPFTTNPSPPCCSTSFRGKELDFGSARLSLLTIGFDESEMLHKDTLRPNASSPSAPQILENDYSNLEMTISKSSCKSLHNMINDTQVIFDRDTSVYVRSVQACNASHFHLLMENINVLEDKVSDSELMKLERDILVQLGRLGALQLFHACLSRTMDMTNLQDQVTEHSRVADRKYNDLTKNVVLSKRKEERKLRQEKRLQATSKRCACRSESSSESSMHHVVSSAAKKTRARGRRAMIAKNEAEMSRGIKLHN